MCQEMSVKEGIMREESVHQRVYYGADHVTFTANVLTIMQ